VVLSLNFTTAMEGRAVIIDRVPSFLQGFFRPLKGRLSKPQFPHLWSLVLALAVDLRAAKLMHLSAAAPGHGHRTSKGAFLSKSDWDAPALVEQAALGLLAGMKPRPGEVLYLILDDNRMPKRGRKMDWVSKIYDHKGHRFVRGHIALTAAVCFRGVMLPWRVELCKPKGQPKGLGPRYRKLTDIAAAMVKAFDAPEGLKVRVLFDAFYLCPKMARACDSKGFTFFSVAARNRNFTTGQESQEGQGKHGGKHGGKRGARRRRRKVATLMPGLIRHQGRDVRMKRSRGKVARLRIACRDGHLSHIGRVRMVVSKRPRGPWKKCIAIVTNETGLKARQIIQIYERRWLIEVMFKELLQDLGLGDYQMLQKDGIVNHLHACCLAHLMLTHRCLESVEGLGEKATNANRQAQMPPMSTRLRTLREQIAEEQIQRLVKGDQHATLRKKLCLHLLGRPPAGKAAA
jgi:SRSO17 transposase